MKSSVTEGHLCLQGFNRSKTKSPSPGQACPDRYFLGFTSEWQARAEEGAQKQHTAICSVSGEVLKEKQSKVKGALFTGVQRGHCRS